MKKRQKKNQNNPVIINVPIDSESITDITKEGSELMRYYDIQIYSEVYGDLDRKLVIKLNKAIELGMKLVSIHHEMLNVSAVVVDEKERSLEERTSIEKEFHEYA